MICLTQMGRKGPMTDRELRLASHFLTTALLEHGRKDIENMARRLMIKYNNNPPTADQKIELAFKVQVSGQVLMDVEAKVKATR